MDEYEQYFFDLNGYVVIENVLTPEQVAACNAAIDHNRNRLSDEPSRAPYLQGLGFAGRGQITRGDALHTPAGDERFDLIFVDPPFVLCRTREEAGGVLSRVEELISRSLESGGVLLLRHPTSQPLVTRSRPADRRAYGASTVIFFENS